jgi:hypothetical protein
MITTEAANVDVNVWPPALLRRIDSKEAIAESGVLAKTELIRPEITISQPETITSQEAYNQAEVILRDTVNYMERRIKQIFPDE